MSLGYCGLYLGLIFGNVLLNCPRSMGHLFPTFRSNVSIRLLSNSGLYPRKKGSSRRAFVKGGSYPFMGKCKSHAAVKYFTGIIYHHVMQLCLMPYRPEGKPSNLDGASPHINNDVTTFLNWQFSERWFGRSRQLAGLPDLQI